jgi:hypothetical protein
MKLTTFSKTCMCKGGANSHRLALQLQQMLEKKAPTLSRSTDDRWLRPAQEHAATCFFLLAVFAY